MQRNLCTVATHKELENARKVNFAVFETSLDMELKEKEKSSMRYSIFDNLEKRL
jgi:hypothetical protein